MNDGLKRGAVIAAIGVVGLLGIAAVTSGPNAGATPITSAAVAPSRAQSAELTAKSTVETTASPTQPGATDKELRQQIVDMLQERMGLSAKEADQQADTMVQHMREVHGNEAGQVAAACGDGDALQQGGQSSYEDMMGGGTGSMMGSSTGSVMGGSVGSMMGNDSL